MTRRKHHRKFLENFGKQFLDITPKYDPLRQAINE